MNPPSITTSFKASFEARVSNRRFVTLEQIKPPSTAYKPTKLQIMRMMYRAFDGFPAGMFRPYGCPIIFDGLTATVYFSFYAFPSSPDLKYELHSSIGKLSKPILSSVSKTFDILVPLSHTYDLDFYPLEANTTWKTPCYIVGCEQVHPPSLDFSGTSLIFDPPVFGVARCRATAYAHKYLLAVDIEKGDNRVTNLSAVITASWVNEKGEDVENKENLENTQLTLEVPECVEFALNMCDGDGAWTHCSPLTPGPPTVYYSTCDGSIVDERSDDPEDWCDTRGFGDDIIAW